MSRQIGFDIKDKERKYGIAEIIKTQNKFEKMSAKPRHQM